MTVGILFSTTNGGTALTDDQDMGSGSNGDTITAQTIYLRHDGANNITNVRFYLRAYASSYTGGATAIDDFAEIIGWGDATTSSAFGGVQFNMDAGNSFPAAQWPTLASKSTTYGLVCRTGYGDSSANAITLSSNTGCTSDGTVQAGSSPNVRWQHRVVVPSDEDTTGVRLTEMVFLYDYTS